MVTADKSFSWRDFIEHKIAASQSECIKSFFQALPYADDLTVGDAQFVALDFETTGLEPDEDEIVSVGLVPFTMDRIKVSQARHWIVRPDCHLNDDSIVIHGITHSDVSNAPKLDEVLEEILDCLKGRIVVVHYQYIEREFLKRAVQKYCHEELIFPMVDTMWLEGLLHRQGWRNKFKRIFGGRLLSIRLADSRLRYALPRYHMHSAVGDAIATAELLQAQIKHRFANSTLVSELCV